jgi:peptidase M1-like protein/carboxypeptidase family protein
MDARRPARRAPAGGSLRFYSTKHRAGLRRARLILIYVSILGLALLASAVNLRADTVSGTVKDPSGALVPGARIEISGGGLAQPIVLISDDSGKFAAPNLNPGKYTVRVTKGKFDEFIVTLDLKGTADLSINLTIAAQQAEVTVTGKSMAFANSDSVYRQLRDLGLGQTYRCENHTILLDVGAFQFKSGTMTIVAPVNRFVTGVIFVGEGHFVLKPVDPMNARELLRRTGSPVVEEDFSEAVFRFAGSQFPEFAGTLGEKVETPQAAVSAYQHWKEKVRRRHEIPESFTQAILEGETIDNVDADVLASVYNPRHPAFINAYIHGAKHKDLRFFVRTRVGAVPQLDSSEEVALINLSEGMDDGVWYSEHLLSELKAGKADSREERRLFATKRYVIETVIGKNNHLHSSATITFEPLIAGERLLKFGLLPNLRVTRVTDQNGQDIHFVQESRKEDGSFYAILDEAPPLQKEHSIAVEYEGDKVLTDAGDGSYYVSARSSWYPNLNGFGEKALYDLTFKVPKGEVVISVGKQQGESTEAGFAVSHWVTPVPVAVAGFNYGRYQKIDMPDTITHYEISGFYLEDLPDSLRPYAEGAFLDSMAPKGMTRYALDQTRAQMQVCTRYFGKSPYDNVYVTEQPNFAFGQSWPNLVYLPISAYIDSTQRWLLFGRIDDNFTGFVREVTPHEVAHQWFGHAVGWASYHDQWLSEGFAEFAAGLFLQQAIGKNWQKDYIDFWERQKKRVLEKNNFGISPNDAGPIWLGLRLISPKTAQGYQSVTYAKGAYILSMLRSIMHDDRAAPDDREKPFIDMMHDFVESHRDAPASTESFKAIVEKHMTKQMDLQQNQRLDWFFDEWVYGTQVPRYSFSYETLPADKGNVRVRVEVTQSDVDEHFAMFVPVYADFGKGMVRIGQVAIAGNSTRKVDFVMDQRPKNVAINSYKEILER